LKKGFLSRLAMLVVCAACLGGGQALAASGNGTIAINVALKTDATSAVLADLGKYGKVKGVIQSIDAVTMQTAESQLSTIRALPYVAAANPDAVRTGAPIDTVTASDFVNGFNTWDLDAVNVTNLQPGPDRVVTEDGTGVYVAVLDTGLLRSWRQYFPEQRIAEEFGIAFSGGGGDNGDNVSTPTDKWEHDTHSHGTHVTSTIIGYSLNGTPINGVAPKATIIPVKVLNQNGSGQSSMVAAGIVYVANLKKNGQLGSSPVVINMSLGGPELDAVEKAAIDYAVANGVILVASAGNNGAAGMGFPGAYAPVISAAASGWINEWQPGADGNPGNWWNADQVNDPTVAADFYITGFSSRQLAGQDLDVAAPGSWVVGPFQLQMGQTSYFFLGGTSMASPHVAGIAALMAQKRPALTHAQAETILTTSAIALPAGCRMVRPLPGVAPAQVCWGDNASGSGLATANAALAATP
jgi:subtilisin family serine protease